MDVLEKLSEGWRLRGDIQADMVAFLTHHGCPQTARHSQQVAVEAKRIAARFGVDEGKAETAGWLHDISAVIPISERLQAALNLGLDVLPEEEQAPMILHQKLSRRIAQEIFQIDDWMVLSAIECHTTLKADASLLDKVVFVADKIAWDQQGEPPYLEELLKALEQSLDRAVWGYLEYLWLQREELPVIHPWMREAYLQIAQAQHDPTF